MVGEPLWMEGKIMQIKHGASVLTRDEKEAGRVERVVIDPRNHEITHLVVGKSLIFNDSRIIPIQMIASTDEDRVLLSTDKDSLEELPYFEETHFIPPFEGDETDRQPGTYAPPLYWYPPTGMTALGYPGYFAYPFPTQTEQNLPAELVPLRDGAMVTDVAGKEVGHVEKTIAGDEQEKVTHFIVGWGILSRNRKLVPIHWVESVSEDEVRLAIHKLEIERLPEYQD
jgi:uncharacterized protein YrrD